MNKIYEFEVWQDDMVQASGGALHASDVLKEADHYAHVYGEDGQVEVRYFIREDISRDALMDIALTEYAT